jgi:hypothetical protein
MRKLLTLTLALLLSTGAYAAIETQTLTVSNGGLTDFYATLDIPQHDTAAEGDLLSIQIEITAELSGEFFYENLGGSSGGYQINYFDWNFSGDFLGQPVMNVDNSFSHPLTLVDPYDGVTDYAGASGVTVPYGGNEALTLSWLPADPGFADFDGTGTLPFDVATTVLTSHSVYGGQSTSGFSTDTTWTIVITYEYDPLTVPTDEATWDHVKSLYR